MYFTNYIYFFPSVVNFLNIFSVMNLEDGCLPLYGVVFRFFVLFFSCPLCQLILTNISVTVFENGDRYSRFQDIPF